MNCPEYDPDAYGCISPLVYGRCPNTSTRQCRNGWIPFWTPAERAGLKRMGRGAVIKQVISEAAGIAAVETICAYVQAARQAKETT